MTYALAPYYEDMADAPDGGACYWVPAGDDVTLRVGFWPLENARGTVLMFPGRTEYIEKYGVTATGLARMGLASAAIDWRGQGLADRVHPDRDAGHVNRFSDYQRDVQAFVDAARALGLPEPYHLLAHSMGGAIGLRALMQDLPVQTASFSAPMWDIALSGALRATAWAVSWAAEQTGLSNLYAPSKSGACYVAKEPFEGNLLTTDPEMFARMRRHVQAVPDLCLGGPSLRWLREALSECKTLAKMPSPDVPCATFLGGNERIVHKGAIRKRMAHWPKVQLTEIPGAEHEILIERIETRENVLAAMEQLITGAAS